MSKRTRAKTNEPPRQEGRAEAVGFHRRLWAGVLAVAALAAATSAYLTYAHYLVMEGGSSFCEVGAKLSCDAVAASAFSAIGGLPIAWMAVVFYAFVGWLAWRVLRGRAPVVPRSPAFALASVGGFAGLFSVALALVSALAIGVFCPLCILLYVLNAALLVLGLVALGPDRARIGRIAASEWRNLRRNLGEVVGAALIAGLLLGALPAARAVRPPLNDLCDYVASIRSGDPGRKVDLVIYSDFQCPGCKLAHSALEPVRETRGVRLTLRHYPLDQACNPGLESSLHPGACLQASAAICAGPRGDSLARRIFETGARGTANLVRLASELGADPKAFEACLGSPETAERLAEDIDAAESDGVRGTPTLVVNGRRYEGRVDAGALSCLARPAGAAAVRPTGAE